MTHLAGVHPSLQVASAKHGIIDDFAINSGLRALLLVDQQYIGLQQMIGTIISWSDEMTEKLSNIKYPLEETQRFPLK